MEKGILQYNPLSSFVDPGFWHKVTQTKLNDDKLEGCRKNIWGSYSFLTDANLLEVNYTAYNNTPDVHQYIGLAYGILLNKNTIEEFKNCDKSELINFEGSIIWEDIKNENCLNNPSLLTRFFILSFADLKKYHYYYWFAFPSTSQPCVYLSKIPIPINENFNDDQILTLIENHKTLDIYQRSFFSLIINETTIKVISIKDAINQINNNQSMADNMCFGFLDSSNNEFPGWNLRNFITLLTYKCKYLYGKNIMFISLRFERLNGYKKSLVFKVFIPDSIDIEWGKNWVGWERNDKGNFGPKFVDMASSMDPKILAETSANLNLQLMKWRLLPNIDLDIIKKTKCLLLGAGTLGCSVARNLLAWGVKNITFVDSGNVSFSNPVRQNLFEHDDCLNGGKPKAIAAAQNLKKIFPNIKSQGFVLNIPMPGHSVSEHQKEDIEKDVKELTNLISNNDVIFLLLDSREARWLPTLIAGDKNKLTINAALGFDSYLVMRHGIFTGNNQIDDENNHLNKKEINGNQLGCYFCNDITSPGNSQKDRTLDQQCTVTRPGVANIASALAVEMCISIIQHKQKINASAPYLFCDEMSDNDSILGPIPHSIRGFLSNYQQVFPTCLKFKQCVACSFFILDNYRNNGFEFLLEVFNNSKYLEDVTGLTDLKIEADIAEVLAFNESDSEE